MRARMDKYDSSTAVKERTEKNKKLYDEVQDMNIDYIDIDVNNAIELNPYGTNNRTRSEYQKQKELNSIISLNDEKREYVEEQEVKEEKIYDINEILKLAKENKLFESEDKKRLINTEYNILTKLDIDEIDKEKDISKENLKDLIDKVYENEKPVTKEKDLLVDLLDNNEEQEEIKEVVLEPEVSKEILEEDNKEEFVKIEDEEKESVTDEENNNETEDLDTTVGTTTDLNIEINKSNKGVVVIIIFVILIFAFIGYMLFKYFSA